MLEAPATATGGLAARLFAGPGEMRALCRAFDWSATPLGPVEGWSHSLRTTAAIVLASRNPMFLWWGPELIQIYNDAYRPSFGRSGRHPRALGMPGRECWTDIWEIIGPQIEGVMTRGESTWQEDAFVPIERNGRLEDVWWTYSYTPVFDDDGRIGGTLVVCQETTRRVLTEVRLQELNRALEVERSRLADVFRQAPSFLAVLRGPDHVFELVNKAYQQLVGPRMLIGLPVREALPELEDQGFVELLDRVLATGEPFVGREVAVRLSRGADSPPEERFADFIYQVLAEADGRRSGVVAHGTDVTAQVHARREVERLLAESERARASLAERDAELEQLATVLESSTDFIALCSPEGAGIYMNEAARRMVGVPDETAVSELRVTDFFFPDDLPLVEGTIFPAMQAGRWRGETRFRHFRTGEAIPVLYDAFRVVDRRTGALIGYGTVTRDLTERDRLVREAEAARAQAEAASRAKDDFLALVSHELRSPLAGIASNAQMMALEICGPVSDRQRQALERIRLSQEHLLRLVEQLLDLKLIGAGRMTYDVAAVSVDDALDAAATLVDSQLEQLGLRLCRPAAPCGLAVHADAGRLRQILVNLLSNAAKFTLRGGAVTLRCEAAVDDATGAPAVRIQVRDTGIGIPPESLAEIFEPFVQVRDRRRPVIAGTGLGLAISRDLARGMGGELTVESVMGEGSTFTLTLPCASDAGSA